MIKRGTKVYSVRRYKITPELRKEIKKSKYSFNKMKSILGFSVKSIYHYNQSIKEESWKKLKELINFKKQLKEIKFNFAKNFGLDILTKLPKPLIKNRRLAEFMGIMLGDGHLGKNVVDISFDKRDIAYQNYVEELCRKLFGLKFRKKFIKNVNCMHLYFYSQFLVNELQRYGLMVGDKIKNNLGIPDWIKKDKGFSKACIKGLIDTDGCIFICKRERQTYINFTNFDKQLFEDFKKLTLDLGYHFAKSNNRNTRLYRKEEVVRFIKQIKPFRASGDMG